MTLAESNRQKTKQHVWEEGTLREELSFSESRVVKSMGNFLDCYLMQEVLPTVDGIILRLVSLDLLRNLAERRAEKNVGLNQKNQ